jgi:hypothetical protein
MFGHVNLRWQIVGNMLDQSPDFKTDLKFI